MARCCSGSSCGCRVTGTGGVSVTGTGTKTDPYVVGLGALSVGGLLVVDDTTSVDLTLGGSGTALNPYVLSAAVKVGATVASDPTNGGSTAIDALTRTQVLSHAAPIASHTITLPATSSALEREIKVVSLEGITALTVNGAVGVTVAGAPTALTAGQYFRMQLIGTVWRRVG